MSDNNRDGVQFSDERNVLYGRFVRGSAEPKLIQWMLRSGFVKTERQANCVVFVFIILAIAISIGLFAFRGRSEDSFPKGTIYPPNEPPRLAVPKL